MLDVVNGVMGSVIGVCLIYLCVNIDQTLLYLTLVTIVIDSLLSTPVTVYQWPPSDVLQINN